MSELYPMAGGLQRAAATTYCGLRGHMATPESLEEATLIAQVVQGSTRNNGSSKVEDWDAVDGSHGPLVGDYGKVWIPVTPSGKGKVGGSDSLTVGRMYVDEPTGSITWQWVDGPRAETILWVGPRPGAVCDSWCNATNNPGYGTTECAANVNSYCTGTARGNGTVLEQASKCSKCYRNLTKTTNPAYGIPDASDPCMRQCGGMRGGKVAVGEWVPWAEGSMHCDNANGPKCVPFKWFVGQRRCAYFNTFQTYGTMHYRYLKIGDACCRSEEGDASPKKTIKRVIAVEMCSTVLSPTPPIPSNQGTEAVSRTKCVT
jgi:hypothetical protein